MLILLRTQCLLIQFFSHVFDFDVVGQSLHDFFLDVLVDYLYDALGPFFLFTAGQNAVL